MKLKFTLCIVVILFVIEILNAQDYSSARNNIHIDATKLVEIDESKYLLGNIVDMLYYENELILIDEASPSILVSDLNGNIDREYKFEGRGPGEFLRPRYSFNNSGSFFIWDAGSLKLIEYDLDFNLVNEYNDLINHSISDFTVNGSTFFGFSSGTVSGATIYAREMQDLDLNRNYNFGTKTQEQVLLMRIQGNGGITSDSDYIYYVTPDSPILNVIDLLTFEEKQINIDFNDFFVPTIDNASKVINEERNRLPEIFSTSSFITGVYALDDFIVVEAHTGTMNVGLANNQKMPKNPYENRRLQLAFFDKDLNQIDLLTFDSPELFSSITRVTHANSIYFLFREVPNFDTQYQIYKMNFQNLIK
jgi:hypothetical protein